jgi:hypothetical protein
VIGAIATGRVPVGNARAALMAGTGLLVFADPAWAHGLGAVALIACAVTVFALASRPAGELPGRQAEPLETRCLRGRERA